MKDKFESIKPVLKPIIIAGSILLVLLIITKVLAIVKGSKEPETSDEPIVKIEATNDKVYKSFSDVDINDFTITATHKDDITEELDVSLVSLYTAESKPVGEEVAVKLILKENKDITCEAKVKIKREKIMGFQCGYPNVTDVIAVLYSNGELCFEGEGDTLVFYEGDYPWLTYDERKDYPIVSVSFQDTVTPTNMNYWFENIDTLIYVDPIPASVRTMVKTFYGCDSLKATSDWTKADSLLNINQAYYECTSLKYIHALPERVRIAKETFSGCSELQKTPDMSKATSLVNTTGMFSNCGKLIQTEMPPNVTDISKMFSGCINLKQMPDISPSVVIMSGCFSGDINLTYLTEIPETVDNISSAFDGCEMITGELVVNANPHNFSSMFSDAAVATKVNLIGNSMMLDVLANTSDSGNIYVNKAKPNPNLKNYNDVFATN